MNWITAAARDLGVTEAEIVQAASDLEAEGLIKFVEPDPPTDSAA
jgi:hypothetical protein